MSVKPDKLQTKIRPIRESDLDFIKSSWKKSYRPYAPWRMERGGTYSPVYNGTYFGFMENILSQYLTDGKHSFLCAADPEDEDFIWGWSCIELKNKKPSACVYAYTRHAARRAGVASSLMLGLKEPIPCRYWTAACEYISLEKPGAIYYSPTTPKQGEAEESK